MQLSQHLPLLLIILIIIVFSARALPFIAGHFLKNSPSIRQLGQSLPAYLMLLLVLYESNFVHINKPPYGIPASFALLSVIFVHLYFRKTIISLLAGMLVFILLTSIFGF